MFATLIVDTAFVSAYQQGQSKATVPLSVLLLLTKSGVNSKFTYAVVINATWNFSVIQRARLSNQLCSADIDVTTSGLRDGTFVASACHEP